MREKRPCWGGGGFLRMDLPGMGMVTADEEGDEDDDRDDDDMVRRRERPGCPSIIKKTNRGGDDD